MRILTDGGDAVSRLVEENREVLEMVSEAPGLGHLARALLALAEEGGEENGRD